MEESVAFTSEENKNATGGALTLASLVYDVYPLAEHVVQAAAAREEKIATFEDIARRCRPRFNKGNRKICYQSGTAASDHKMFGHPLACAEDGDDGGCELCHNEYDNTQNECPVAIRERILFLREREVQKVKVRQQQQEGKEEGDG